VQLELLGAPATSVHDVALNALAPSAVPDVARLTVPGGCAGLVTWGEAVSVSVIVQLDGLCALNVDGTHETVVEVLSGGAGTVSEKVPVLPCQLGGVSAYVPVIVGVPASDCLYVTEQLELEPSPLETSVQGFGGVNTGDEPPGAFDVNVTDPVGEPMTGEPVSVTVAVHVVGSVARSAGSPDGTQVTPVVVVFGGVPTFRIVVPGPGDVKSVGAVHVEVTVGLPCALGV
jgi:hypothetical protein